jgi:hypothetical protein
MVLLDLIVAETVARQPLSRWLQVAIGVSTVASFIFWRPAVYGIFCLAFVVGYLRNLFDSPTILLAKDVLLVAVCVRVLGEVALRRDARLHTIPIAVPLAVFAGIVLVQSFNPHVESPLEALVGVRTWLFYIVLYFVGRQMITTGSQAWRFAAIIITSASAISALAILQWVLGPTAFSSQGRAFGDATFVINAGAPEQVFRPNATFAWPSHFAIFLAMATLVCLGAVLASHGASQLLLIGVLALLLLVNVIEAQRLIYFVLPPLILVVLLIRGVIPRGRALLAAAVIGCLTLIGLVLLDTGSRDPLIRVKELISDPGTILGERGTGYIIYVQNAFAVSPLGLGTGATAIGSRWVLNTVPLFVENPVAKVIGELSVVGLAAYAWLLWRLILTTARSLRAEVAAGHGSKADFMAGTLGCQLLVIFTGYDIAVAAMLLWFLSGAISRPWVDQTQ